MARGACGAVVLFVSLTLACASVGSSLGCKAGPAGRQRNGQHSSGNAAFDANRPANSAARRFGHEDIAENEMKRSKVFFQAPLLSSAPPADDGEANSVPNAVRPRETDFARRGVETKERDDHDAETAAGGGEASNPKPSPANISTPESGGNTKLSTEPAPASTTNPTSEHQMAKKETPVAGGGHGPAESNKNSETIISKATGVKNTQPRNDNSLITSGAQPTAEGNRSPVPTSTINNEERAKNKQIKGQEQQNNGSQSTQKSGDKSDDVRVNRVPGTSEVKPNITDKYLNEIKEKATRTLNDAKESAKTFTLVINNLETREKNIKTALGKIEDLLSKASTSEKKEEMEKLKKTAQPALEALREQREKVKEASDEVDAAMESAENYMKTAENSGSNLAASEAYESAIASADEAVDAEPKATGAHKDVGNAEAAFNAAYKPFNVKTATKESTSSSTLTTHDKSITGDLAPLKYQYNASGCPIEKSSVLPPYEIQPMRLVAYTKSLDRYSKYCEKADGSENSIRPDFWNNKIQCSPGGGTDATSDVFTAEKRTKINEVILPALIKAFEKGPLRYRAEGPLRVPYLRFGNRCQHFMFPEAHNKIGVNDSDVMLYVGAMPMRPTDDSNPVRAEPCTSIDGRVVAVALNFNPRNILDGKPTIHAAVKAVSKAIGASPCPCDSAVVLTLKHYKYSWKRLNYCAASYFDGSNNSMEVYFEKERQWFHCSKNRGTSSGIWAGPFVCQISEGPNANKVQTVKSIDETMKENGILHSLPGDSAPLNVFGSSNALLVLLFLLMFFAT